MTKQRKNQKEKVKGKEKETNPSLNPSQVSGLGLAQTGQRFHPEEVAGIAAPTVAVEGGGAVQVGQADPEQLATAQTAEQRTVHPEIGTVFKSNITKYKDRNTEFLTLPMKLVTQPRYPFKGAGKQEVRITLTDDGNKLVVERAWE